MTAAEATPTLQTLIGRGYGEVGDGPTATSALLANNMGMAADASGNLYIADRDNNRIRKITPAGAISTVAGTGQDAYGGDGSLAVNARLSGPNGVSLDSSGNLYIADTGNNRIRKVTVATGIITTIAGNGVNGYSGDGAAATSAKLKNPSAVAIDSSGNVYIADRENRRVRKLTISDGNINTVAGNGTQGSAGDNGPAASANLNFPVQIALDASGNLYIADRDAHRIRKVDSGTQVITTFAGTGTGGNSGNGGAAASAQLNNPTAVYIDASGNVYICDKDNHVVRKVSAATGFIDVFAGDDTGGGDQGNNGSAINARFNGVQGITGTAAGVIYIADTDSSRVRKVDTAGIITAVSGIGQYNLIDMPKGVLVDGSGNRYISSTNLHAILKLPRGGGFSVIAGTIGQPGNSGDNGQATSALLRFPGGLAMDSSGNIYFADTSNHVIRKIDTSGVITTVAGIMGNSGNTGDGAAATSAKLNTPSSVTVKGTDLYIADTNNNRVRKVDGTTGFISAVAGTGTSSYTGDGALATAATLKHPRSVAFDSTGNMYIADADNAAVRKVNASDSNISTVVGNGSSNFSGDGGLASSAQVYTPTSVTIDGSNNLYLADASDGRIRKVNASDGKINTVVSSGNSFDTGESGSLTSLGFSSPYAITVTPDGFLTIADSGHQRVLGTFDTPGTPTDAAATASNSAASATVTFTAPEATGGGITSYTATSSPGSFTGTCSASPCTVTGLAYSTAYTFTVTANNPSGPGSASTASGSVTSAAAPVTATVPPVVVPPVPTSGTFTVTSTSPGTLSGVGNVTLGSSSMLTIANGASGSTLRLPAPSAAGSTVTLLVDGTTVNVTASTPGTTLSVQRVVSSNGTITTTLAITGGKASFTSASGSPLLTVGSKLVLTAAPATSSARINGDGSFAADTGSSATNVAASVDASGNTTITVQSGAVMLPCAQLPSGACVGTNAIYKVGDTLTFDAAGTLLSAQSGELLTALPVYGTSTLPSLVNLNTATGHAADYNGRMTTLLTSSLNMGSAKGSQSANGSYTLRFTSGVTLNVLPLGSLNVIPGLTDGVTTLADGRTTVSSDGVVLVTVPTVADTSKLAAAFLSNGTPRNVILGTDGTLRLTYNQQTDVYRPFWLTTPGADARVSVTPSADGGYLYLDGLGNSQRLYPSFADLQAITTLMLSVDAKATVQSNTDASVSVKVSGNSYTFTAAPTLLPVPASHAKDAFWVEGGQIYLKTRDGSAAQQVFVK